MVLCDTDVIIELLKGNEKTLKKVKVIGLKNVCFSSVTVMELFYGAINKDEVRRIKRDLRYFNVVHLDQIVSEITVGLIEQYAKSHDLRIPDAMIAATSIANGFDLFTYNLKDFKYVKGLTLVEV